MISEGFYSTIPSSYKEGYTSNLETQFKNIEQVDDTNKEIRASLGKYQGKLSDLNRDYKDYYSNNPDNNPDGSIYLDYNDRKTTLEYAVKEDIHQMIIQQNNSYIIGMITITTVLITTYLVLRK